MTDQNPPTHEEPFNVLNEFSTLESVGEIGSIGSFADIVTEMKDAIEPTEFVVPDDLLDDHASYILVPEGMEVREAPRPAVPMRRRRPRRKCGNSTVDRLTSFLEWVKNPRHHTDADGDRSIWWTGQHFVAVMNGDGIDEPGWGDLRCHYQPKLSREFIAWQNFDRAYHDQETFVEFVDDWSHTFRNPSARDMVDVASKFRAMKSVEFERVLNQRDGSTQLTYVEVIEETRNQGTIDLPNELELFFPVFEGSGETTVKARLRFKLRSGVVKFSVVLEPLDILREKAIDQMIYQIDTSVAPPYTPSEDATVPVIPQRTYHGTPPEGLF